MEVYNMNSNSRLRMIINEAIKEVVGTITNERLFELAKKKFGVTNDIREAGYVLPDGSMLDFSGRHELDKGTDSSFLRGSRHVDHREIHVIAYDDDENSLGFKIDMSGFIEAGAIRIDDNAGTINLYCKPTIAQKRILRLLIARNDGDVSVDFGNGYDSEWYIDYERVNVRRVLNDIDRYFDEWIKPVQK